VALQNLILVKENIVQWRKIYEELCSQKCSGKMSVEDGNKYEISFFDNLNGYGIMTQK
jgi:hypothetical protein